MFNSCMYEICAVLALDVYSAVGGMWWLTHDSVRVIIGKDIIGHQINDQLAKIDGHQVNNL